MAYINLLAVTDSHLGFLLNRYGADGSEQTYWAQTPWENGHTQLFDRLRTRCKELNVDAVIHCGDLTHASGREDIQRAIGFLRSLHCPIVFAFGNHDRRDRQAGTVWAEELEAAPWLCWSGRGMLSTANCDVIPVDNVWLDADGVYQPWWTPSSSSSPVPGISDAELARLADLLEQNPDKPAIVVIHAPCWLFPPLELQLKLGQTGMDHTACYSTRLSAVLQRYPRVRLVLSGHIHSTRSMQLGAVYLSTAAFFEAPHQVRVITVDTEYIRVKTEALWLIGDPVQPLESRGHLLGEPRDQHVVLRVKAL